MDNDQVVRLLKENTDAITRLTVESAEVKSGLKSLEARVEDVKDRVEQVKADVAANHNFMLGFFGAGFSVLTFVVVFAAFVFTTVKQ